MPIYKCRSCQARNVDGGRCIVCGESLGHFGKAIVAAAVSSIALGVGGLLISLIGLQLVWLAALYGGFVSGAVAHYSGGRGIRYQLVATVFTLVGIVAFDTTIVWLHWPQRAYGLEANPVRPEFLTQMQMQFESDPITGLLCVIGVLGGLWLWK